MAGRLMSRSVVLLSIPGLRFHNLGSMSRLKSLAKSGSAARFTATLPAAATSVQATLLTGTTPTQHGAIADAFFDRSSGVIKRACPAESLHSPPLWAPLKHRDPAFTTAIWFSPLAPAANVDCACRIDAAVASPADGRPAVVTSPQELADALVGCLGPFPSESPDDPHSGMRSLAWIVDSFVQTAYSLKPRFSLVVLSHIERLATKFGPGSPEAQSGLGELDLAIGALVDGFLAAGIRDAVWIVAGEDCFTEVNAVSLPNATLKEAGLLTSSASSGAAALVGGDSRHSPWGRGHWPRSMFGMPRTSSGSLRCSLPTRSGRSPRRRSARPDRAQSSFGG